jgi:hypothetical protein
VYANLAGVSSLLNSGAALVAGQECQNAVKDKVPEFGEGDKKWLRN